jgi:hypothetical protein
MVFRRQAALAAVLAEVLLAARNERGLGRHEQIDAVTSIYVIVVRLPRVVFFNNALNVPHPEQLSTDA